MWVSFSVMSPPPPWLSRRPLEPLKFIVWYNTQALLPNLQTSIDSHWFPKVGKSSIRSFGTVAALHRPVARLDSVHFDELRAPGFKFQEFAIDFHVIGKWMENHVCRSSRTKNVISQDEEKQQGEKRALWPRCIACTLCNHKLYSRSAVNKSGEKVTRQPVLIQIILNNFL